MKFLPTERAGEAAVYCPASQAAGTEVVVTVQEAGMLILLMAQETYQGVAVGIIQVAEVFQRRENPTGHLEENDTSRQRDSTSNSGYGACGTVKKQLFW